MILNLFDRMKLPFRKNKEFLSALYDILGFYPHNLDIYRIAFSHKSLSYHRDNDAKVSGKDRKGGAKERRKPRTENTSKPLNNERLEYLGDAVLESVVSDILFRHFPNKREGFLTSTRSKIVQREALNHLAADMGLEKLILAAQGTRMAHTNIGGNAFEALMGAIYLDRGYKHCHWFISNRVIGRYVDLENVAQKEVNFKSKLLEWSQKNRINISFKDSADDNKGFKTIIVMEGITLARGNGRSKKESQQEASKEALTRMRREPKTYDNIFRAKEKRTAMEAEESFALPKIDEIENSISKGKKTKAAKNEADAPVLEDKKQAPQSASDAAYDTAYDETATFEVIDTPPEEPQLSAEYYEEKGLPAPPEEDELRAADEKLRKKRARNRGAKTVGDAVKGVKKGVSTPEEKAERREAERLAEVERQRAKAERKRKQIEAQQAADKTAAKAQKTAETSIEETIVATEDIPETGVELAEEVAKPIVEEAIVTEKAPERVVEETIAVEEEPEQIIEGTIAVEEEPEQVIEETIAVEEEP
uniref:ribonuclease III domain-containing protein n=1 Tax=Alloprevotella sp. TaxID=1872471 RepID=UPI003FEF5F49